ncbi:MAG: EamA family transporter [Bacteroidia bacterium]|nr:EamA family transporter [Bacteroidia bacterium]
MNKIQAILVNYLVCFSIGFVLSGDFNLLKIIGSDWFKYCIILGSLFVAIFLSMAMTTEKYGVSVNAVSAKMSVIIPVLFAYVYNSERLTIQFVVGILLSLLSIYLITKKKQIIIPKKYIYLPIIVFFGSGTIDTSLKLLELNYSNDISINTISYSIFLGAFLVGTTFYSIKNQFNFSNWSSRNIISGIILGIPNYFSIYFLLTAIKSFSLKSAFVFGINNIGIVLLSTLLSVIIFKEKLTLINKFGVLISVLSIILIAYAS